MTNIVIDSSLPPDDLRQRILAALNVCTGLSTVELECMPMGYFSHQTAALSDATTLCREVMNRLERYHAPICAALDLRKGLEKITGEREP